MADESFIVQIKTPADLAGVRALKSTLEEAATATRAAGRDATALESRLKQVNTALDSESGKAAAVAAAMEKVNAAQAKLQHSSGGGDLSTVLGKMSSEVPGLSRVNELVEMVSGHMAGAAAAGGAAAASIGLIVESLKEFAGAQEAVISLQAALAQTGQLGAKTLDELQKKSDELQNSTAVSNDTWTQAITRLVQFGASADEIDKPIDAVKNLAALMNGDVQSASMAVSKALQGNFMALSRFGIKVDENASQVEKFDQACKKLAAQGGGQMEARAQSLGKQWEQFKLQTLDLLKILGSGVNTFDLITDKIHGLVTALQYYNEKLGSPIKGLDNLKNATGKTNLAIEDGIEPAKRYATQIAAIGKAAEEADKQVAGLLARLNQTKSQEEQVDAAQKALELAQIDDRVKRGKLGEVDASRQRAGVEGKYAGRQQARDDRFLADSNAAQQDRIDRAKADADAVQKALTQAKDDYHYGPKFFTGDPAAEGVIKKLQVLLDAALERVHKTEADALPTIQANEAQRDTNRRRFDIESQTRNITSGTQTYGIMRDAEETRRKGEETSVRSALTKAGFKVGGNDAIAKEFVEAVNTTGAAQIAGFQEVIKSLRKQEAINNALRKSVRDNSNP